jgi:hypothetical protein
MYVNAMPHASALIIHIRSNAGRVARSRVASERDFPMTKPIPDKAEVALEYPDKLYIGTFERTSRFDAHLDQAGISLSLERSGDADVRKTIRMHFHYGLFAEILADLAKSVSAFPTNDIAHRDQLAAGAKALWQALNEDRPDTARNKAKPNGRAAKDDETDVSRLSPEEEVLLLHILE